jgi:coniferyl-aldehyde dehydrogenase
MNEHARPVAAAPDPIADIEQRFWSMHRASRTEPPTTGAQRKALLSNLRELVSDHARDFAAAIAQDFGWRSHDETLLAEVLPTLGGIKDALRNVDRWMRPEARSRTFNFWPARNRVYRQPKGVVLIIAPWNYPMQLAVGPLTAALAAGNRVVIKPSEATPGTADALKRYIEGALGPDRVTVATGDVAMAQALSALPFDHILFTGSTAVGKLVMQAAARNLTPVTLELGGKSPAIVHGDFDHALAARRIVRGKLLNAGQTCIAPDYALVQRDRVEEFVRLVRESTARFYPRLVDNRDYTAIVSQRHYERLAGLVADARSQGARVVTIDPAGELAAGEAAARNARKLAPIVITEVTDKMAVMQEEIFGPILPVIAYDTLVEAIAFVNAGARPLALYYFDTDSSRIDEVLQRTVSGGASINDTILHFAQEGLPFGGIGPSGMGAYHGQDGFCTFSHAKGVFHQGRWSLTDLLVPPYGSRFRRLVHSAIRRSGGRLPAR